MSKIFDNNATSYNAGSKNKDNQIKTGAKIGGGLIGFASAIKTTFSSVFLPHWAIGIIMFLFVMCAIFGATNFASPNIMNRVQSVNALQKKVDEGKSLNNTEQKDYEIFSNPDDFYNGASDRTKEIFSKVTDYNSSATAFTNATYNFLQDAYDNKFANALADAKMFLNGESVVNFNEEMTKQQFLAQGNPFANANICAIASAYAVFDDTYEESTLKKYDEVMGDSFTQSRFLTATYYWDSVDDGNNKANDGIANNEKTVTPVDVYKYKSVNYDLTKNEYYSYLSFLPVGDNAIVKVCKDTLSKRIEHEQVYIDAYNNDIKRHQNNLSNVTADIKDIDAEITNKNEKIEKLQKKNKEYQEDIKKKPRKKDSLQKKIDENNKEIDKLKKEIDELNIKKSNSNNGYAVESAEIERLKTNMQPHIDVKNFCEYVKAQISSGAIAATVDNIDINYMEETYANIKCYEMVYNKDKTPKVDHKVSDEKGSLEDSFHGFATRKNDAIYVKGEKEMVFPEVDIENYATVHLEPFSSDCSYMLETFKLKPNDLYVQSKTATEHMAASFIAKIRKPFVWVKNKFEGKTDEEIKNDYSDGLAITNEMAFWNYYKTLEATTSMANYSSANATHGCILSKEDIQNYINNAVAQCPDLSPNRQEFMKTALSLTGAIPYQWGGKPVKAGWDETWWSTLAEGEYKGLDCSGFVSWVRWTAWDIPTSLSTGGFASSDMCTVIDSHDLKPGDLGVIYYGGSNGSQTNHIGIYLGVDSDGNKLWCHCEGGNGVVVNKTNCFKIYLRLNDSCLEGSDKWKDWSEFQSYGFAVADADAMNVITSCLIAEDSNDVGMTATSEAMANHCGGGIGRAVTEQQMLELAMSPSYLVAGSDNGHYVSQYEAIFVRHSKSIPSPTMTQYQLVEGSIHGRRTYILDDAVKYWRSKNITSLKGYTFYGQFPEGSGNNFFKAN
ncbi:MAG: C40 family peptidase [Lachnospiraceae bacterium]|nr:C40 family peptidase [Lachnospiraceae bacterium]